MYKLIAKLMASRRGNLMPKLVNEQQTGFIKGRNILENISLDWLVKDWMVVASLQALFLLLDFAK